MDSSSLRTSIENRILTIAIDNPPANSLSSKVLSELAQVLEAANDDASIKVVIITGTGKFFIAGADIHEFPAITSKAAGKQFAEKGQRLMEQIENMRKPVIAQINGYCLGGGLELAMACHVRVASETAHLGLPELHLGIIPGYGGTQRLPRIVNPGKALELILTGERISGKEAWRIGLVSDAVAADKLDVTVQQMAMKMAEKSLPSITAVLNLIRCGGMGSAEERFACEAEAFGERFESADAKEGIQAFIEKRTPKFKDR